MSSYNHLKVLQVDDWAWLLIWFQDYLCEEKSIEIIVIVDSFTNQTFSTLYEIFHGY